VRFLALAAVLALSACAQPAELPQRPVAAGPGIAIAAQPVPLNPADPAQTAIGDFTYVGGLALTSGDTSRLHGLSDLKITPKGELTAESDEGDLLRAHLVLDAQGRPAGLDNARLSVLAGEDGKALQGKTESDSEGVAILPNGDMLVSFEEHDRILVYPAAGGPPRLAPSPDVKFPFNLGMEGLAADPAAGRDAYYVGGEASGQTWVCRLSGGCTADRLVAKPPEYGLTAIAPLGDGRMAYLLRAWDPLQGSRVFVTVLDAQGVQVGRLELARPFTVDNFEGLAALPGKGGTVRFYLISDDNFSSSQRTLLLAFDWKPTRKP
jgi:hypothetical protein